MVFDSLVGCRLWNKSRLEKRSFLESSAIPEIQRAAAPLKGLVVLVRSTEAHEAKIFNGLRCFYGKLIGQLKAMICLQILVIYLIRLLLHRQKNDITCMIKDVVLKNSGTGCEPP